MTKQLTRRDFLKQGGAFTAASGVGMPLVFNLMGAEDALAASAQGYKAVVCVFLAGGNDAYSTVVRSDVGLARYSEARNNISGDLVLTSSTPANTTLDPKALVLDPTTFLKANGSVERGIPAGLALALNPKLKFVAAQCNQHKPLASNESRPPEFLSGVNVAIIGNIGPLLAPTIAADYITAPNGSTIPPKLQSHNDQQSFWQSGAVEGATSGWGGELVRLASKTYINKVSGSDTNQFAAMSLSGTPVFTTSVRANPILATYSADKIKGAVRIGHYDGTYDGTTNKSPDESNGATNAAYLVVNQHWQRSKLLTALFDGTVGTSDQDSTPGARLGHFIEADYAAKLRNANKAWSALTDGLGNQDNSSLPIDIDGQTSGSDIKSQLEMVAKIIAASGNAPLETQRQVFFVQQGGYDTHSGQTGAGNNHASLLRTLDSALRRFYQLLAASGNVDKVVTFTASDFGRKFNQNGDGTDHGWGGHHFVIGGAPVKAGVYGHFPDLTQVSGQYRDPQLLWDGMMVPTVPVDNLVWSLSRWMGVDMENPANKTVLTPNLMMTDAHRSLRTLLA